MKHRLNKPEVRSQRSEVGIPPPNSKFAEGRIRLGGLRAASESAFFNPRVLLALALCSCGVLLGMFSLAATPGETKRSNTSTPANPLLAQNSRSTLSSNANPLPPGVRLPASLRAGALSEPEAGLD